MMSRETHVRFCESAEVKLPRATHLAWRGNLKFTHILPTITRILSVEHGVLR